MTRSIYTGVDTQFQSLDFNGPIFTILELSGDRILVGGGFNQIRAGSDRWLGRPGLVMLHNDGSLNAPDFNTNPHLGSKTVYALLDQNDGRILIGGSSLTGAKGFIMRLNVVLTDFSFRPPTLDGEVRCIVAQADGKLLIGGHFTSIEGKPSLGIARLSSDGIFDSAFDANIQRTVLFPENQEGVSAIAIQRDGKIVIGGNFSKVGGKSIRNLARLNSDGGLDESFDPDFGGTVVTDIAIQQQDEKLLVSGSFPQGVTRLNKDGSRDNAFNVGSGTENGAVFSLAVQADEKVVIGGAFLTLNGTAQNYIARLNKDGSTDRLFAPRGGGGPIYSIALQSDEKVVVGGGANSGIIYRLLPRPDAVLSLRHSNLEKIILGWTNSAFSLQTATDVSGPYVLIPEATSPYTNQFKGPSQFFRLWPN